MKNRKIKYAARQLFPFLFLSLAAGIMTGILIFLFKYCASAVISFSNGIYAFVRANPIYLPALILGAALIGLLSALILKFAPDCRGGGIPTSITILRGLLDFHWVKSIFLLFPSAMLTYLAGVPLGNEGPSVQMGTAAGRATVRLFAKKRPAWDRYIMTGGACAGFAAATGAPITGIFFAFEEAHRRFSPMIFMAASMTVIGSTAAMETLCTLTGTEYSLFRLHPQTPLPLYYLWTAAAVGLASAVGAILFTKLYRYFRTFIKKTLADMNFILKIVIIFTAVSLIGFCSAQCIGSGHSLVDLLIEGGGVWYMLILYFSVRAVLLIVANNADVTGGLFVPTLAFGAVIGALCGKGLVALHLLPPEHYVLMVIIGIASFMGASSRTPIIAITFSVEALSGFDNILPIIVGVSVAYLVMETLGITAFTENVIEGKLETAHAGKKPRIIDAHLDVAEGSFAAGKEIRDIFWPPTCTVLSVHKNAGEHHGQQIESGDVLHVHYQTYNPEETMRLLEDLVGKQSSAFPSKIKEGREDHHIPEL